METRKFSNNKMNNNKIDRCDHFFIRTNTKSGNTARSGTVITADNTRFDCGKKQKSKNSRRHMHLYFHEYMRPIFLLWKMLCVFPVQISTQGKQT